jgi:4-amino-4-deoxy-L-arabinose transferase-like glycosyltransferase
MQQTTREHRSAIAAAFVMAVVCGLFAWNAHHTATAGGVAPTMIQATYLDIAARWVDPAAVDLSLYGDILSTRFYPPFYLASLAAAFRAVGVGYGAAGAVNALLGVLGLLGVFLAARAWSGPWAGVLAAVVLGATPAFSQAAPLGSIDFAIACFAALAFGCLATFLVGGNRAALVGFAAAIATGLLCRWSFAVFLAALVPPAALDAWCAPPDRKARRRWAWLALAAAVGTLPLVIWLTTSANPGLLLNAAGDEVRLMSLVKTLVHYPGILAAGLGAGLALPLALGLVSPWLWRRREAWPVLGWLLLGWAFFSALPPKQPRYILYLFPAAALLVTLAVGTLPRRGWRLGAGSAVAVLAVITALAAHADAPARSRAPMDAVLAAITADAGPDARPTVLVHDRFVPPEGPFSSLSLAFHQAARGAAPFLFVEGAYLLAVVYQDACEPVDHPFDYVVLVHALDTLPREQVTRLPFFSCFELTPLAEIDAAPVLARPASAVVFRHAR